MPGWWNGRHRGLKIPRGNPCGFKSRLGHQFIVGPVGISVAVTGRTSAFALIYDAKDEKYGAV